MRAYQTLKVWREGPVGWLSFDRPDRGNAMDATMLDELETAWRELDADDDVRVVVTTGEGSSFQTGVDVVQVSRDRDALKRHARRTRDFELRFTAWHCGVWKPVVAAVNGVCAGGGLHFVADADVVVASTAAVLLDPHTSIGQVVAYEGIALARKSPMEAVLRMALTGSHERVPAARAHQLGIFGAVVEPARLRAEAQALGERIARNSPVALRETKRALWEALEVGLTEARRRGARRVAAVASHPDCAEGARAWLEQREPIWSTADGIGRSTGM